MSKKWWIIALVISLALATISPLASSAPDGLERVAEDNGFLSLALEAPFEIVADYVFPGIANEALATIIAGWLGTILLFIAVYGLAWLIKSRRRTTTV
ncbi:MAG TPA: hypothetical protein G4O01_05900 [Dehalococcoidia bacterium]|jgi:hypothetical protein|nr:hypothetical protein [Dehalococcoidia bacterium]